MILDGRKNNKGVKGKAGRKPKADEIKKIELMDSVLAPIEAWQALSELIREGDVSATKYWLDQRFGKAKETVDMKQEISEKNLPSWMDE